MLESFYIKRFGNPCFYKCIIWIHLKKINKSIKIINFINWTLISSKNKTLQKKKNLKCHIHSKAWRRCVYNFQTSKVYKSPRSTWRQHPAPTNPTDPDVKAGGGGEREGFSQIQLSMERKKEKKKKERRREREAEQRYFHWHGSRAAISFFHHTTNMSLLFWHLLTLTSKSSSLLKNYLSLGMN